MQEAERQPSGSQPRVFDVAPPKTDTALKALPEQTLPNLEGEHEVFTRSLDLIQEEVNTASQEKADLEIAWLNQLPDGIESRGVDPEERLAALNELQSRIFDGPASSPSAKNRTKLQSLIRLIELDENLERAASRLADLQKEESILQAKTREIEHLRLPEQPKRENTLEIEDEDIISEVTDEADDFPNIPPTRTFNKNLRGAQLKDVMRSVFSRVIQLEMEPPGEEEKETDLSRRYIELTNLKALPGGEQLYKDLKEEPAIAKELSRLIAIEEQRKVLQAQQESRENQSFEPEPPQPEIWSGGELPAWQGKKDDLQLPLERYDSNEFRDAKERYNRVLALLQRDTNEKDKRKHQERLDEIAEEIRELARLKRYSTESEQVPEADIANPRLGPTRRELQAQRNALEASIARIQQAREDGSIGRIDAEDEKEELLQQVMNIDEELEKMNGEIAYLAQFDQLMNGETADTRYLELKYWYEQAQLDPAYKAKLPFAWEDLFKAPKRTFFRRKKALTPPEMLQRILDVGQEIYQAEPSPPSE